jgi:hypothetical protein
MIEIGLLLRSKDGKDLYRSVYTSSGVLVRGVDLNIETNDVLKLNSVNYRKVTFQISDGTLIINPVLKVSKGDSIDSNNIVEQELTG